MVNNFWPTDQRPLRRFVFTRPVLLDPKSTEKYPYYKSTIYEVDGHRRKWTEQINRWPPQDFMGGEIILTIVRKLITEKYKGKVEITVPWIMAHKVLTYVMPKHEQPPANLYYSFYKPYELAYKLAKENEIALMEDYERPPIAKVKRPAWAKKSFIAKQPQITPTPPKPVPKPEPRAKNKVFMNKVVEIMKKYQNNQASKQK